LFKLELCEVKKVNGGYQDWVEVADFISQLFGSSKKVGK
jgi:hypothetical protein